MWAMHYVRQCQDREQSEALFSHHRRKQYTLFYAQGIFSRALLYTRI